MSLQDWWQVNRLTRATSDEETQESKRAGERDKEKERGRRKVVAINAPCNLTLAVFHQRR